jgi:N-acetylmuramoyl-L-alanine amidase
MLRSFVIIISLFLSSASVLFAKDEYAIAKVKKGENIETFLKRYLLTPHKCNIDAFAKINSLKSKNKIISGKIYKLPLKIINYDGKSIRSSCGISEFDQAKSIERYNLNLLEKGVRTQHFKENRKIWHPYAEFDCSKPSTKEVTTEKVVKENTKEKEKEKDAPKSSVSDAPSKTSFKRTGIATINAPIMGPEYAEVNIEDYSLKGQVFYVIAGHGGPDPGAVCSANGHDLCEDEYAYDVALRLARDLMQHGATVHLIVQDQNDGIRDDAFLDCDRDEKDLGEYTIPCSQKQRLRDRAAHVNRLYNKYKKKGVKIQKSIEIHVDSRSVSQRQDAFFYYNDADPKSKELATDIQNVFEAKYDEHQKDRGYKGYVESRNIYMVKHLKPTTVFVELANIRNKSDQQRLLINSNRQALANWLFEGLRKAQ